MDYLNFNVCPLETNVLLIWVIFNGSQCYLPIYETQALQYHYSHFIIHVYKIMKENALEAHRIAGTHKAVQQCDDLANSMNLWLSGPARAPSVCLPEHILKTPQN